MANANLTITAFNRSTMASISMSSSMTLSNTTALFVEVTISKPTFGDYVSSASFSVRRLSGSGRIRVFFSNEQKEEIEELPVSLVMPNPFISCDLTEYLSPTGHAFFVVCATSSVTVMATTGFMGPSCTYELSHLSPSDFNRRLSETKFSMALGNITLSTDLKNGFSSLTLPICSYKDDACSLPISLMYDEPLALSTNSLQPDFYFPTGLRLNLHQFIWQENGSYIYMDGKGKRHVFSSPSAHVESNIYFDECGSYLILETPALSIVDPKGNKLLFTNGRLSTILLKTGVSFTSFSVIWDSNDRISSLVRGNSTVLSIDYDSQQILLKAFGSTDRTISVAFNQSGTVSSITDRDGTLYSLTLNNQCVESLSCSGRSISCERDWLDRVSSIKEFSGTSLMSLRKIHYFNNATSMDLTPEGNQSMASSTIFSFDQKGITHSETSAGGTIISAEEKVESGNVSYVMSLSSHLISSSVEDSSGSPLNLASSPLLVERNQQSSFNIVGRNKGMAFIFIESKLQYTSGSYASTSGTVTISASISGTQISSKSFQLSQLKTINGLFIPIEDGRCATNEGNIAVTITHNLLGYVLRISSVRLIFLGNPVECYLTDFSQSNQQPSICMNSPFDFPSPIDSITIDQVEYQIDATLDDWIASMSYSMNGKKVLFYSDGGGMIALDDELFTESGLGQVFVQTYQFMPQIIENTDSQHTQYMPFSCVKANTVTFNGIVKSVLSTIDFLTDAEETIERRLNSNFKIYETILPDGRVESKVFDSFGILVQEEKECYGGAVMKGPLLTLHPNNLSSISTNYLDSGSQKTTSLLNAYSQYHELYSSTRQGEYPTIFFYDSSSRMCNVSQGSVSNEIDYSVFGPSSCSVGNHQVLSFSYGFYGPLSISYEGKASSFIHSFTGDSTKIINETTLDSFHRISTYDIAGKLISKTIGSARIAEFEYDSGLSDAGLTSISARTVNNNDVSIAISKDSYGSITSIDDGEVHISYSSRVSDLGDGENAVAHIVLSETTEIDNSLWLNREEYRKHTLSSPSMHKIWWSETGGLTYVSSDPLASQDGIYAYIQASDGSIPETIAFGYEWFSDSNSNKTTLISSSYFAKIDNNSSNKNRINYEYAQSGDISKIDAIFCYYKNEYVYDSLGRLSEEKLNHLETIRYSYDANGNLIERKIISDNAETVVYSASFTNDKIISSVVEGNPKQYSYNSSTGLPTMYKGMTVTTSGPFITTLGNTTYSYDGLGRRTVKVNTVIGTRSEYIYVGNKLIGENRWVNGYLHTLKYIYIKNDVVGMICDGTTYLYCKNILGDVVALLNVVGERVAVYRYDGYGKHISITFPNNLEVEPDLQDAAKLNPFRYRSYYYDEETSTYYLGHRFYDPEAARFLTRDDVDCADPYSIFGMNLYCYCKCNPMRYSDPSGHMVVSSFLIGLAIAAGVGALTGAAAYTVSELISFFATGEWSWSWGQFAGSVIGGTIGGILSYVLPEGLAFLAAGIEGFSSTSIGMALQNAWEGSDYSVGQIMIESAVGSFISIVSTAAFGVFKIRGYNSGRGSYSAISKQIYTKFKRGMIKRISSRTFEKILAVSLGESAVESIISGLDDGTEQTNEFIDIGWMTI
ncbi:MAG: hypothetical protein IJ247_02550 [Bacilli bacterium]|nr:hypothetical protein [Bacilli bacterium]